MRRHYGQMHWQIASAYILLITATLSLFAGLSFSIIRRTYLSTLESGVAGQARLVASLVERDDLASPSELATVVRDLQQRLSARVTVVGVDGTVLADSGPGTGTNIADRVEIQTALKRGLGESTRISTATGDNMFYVAVPVGPADAPTGAARVGVPLTTIADAERRIGSVVLLTTLAASASAIALAILIARRTTRPLLGVRAAAARLASGDLEVQLPQAPTEEVAALAQDFNLMASRLRQLIAARDAERQQLATVLATMTDGVLIVEGAERVVLLNAAARRLVAAPDAATPIPLTALAIAPALTGPIRTVLHDHPSRPIIVDDVPLPHIDGAARLVVTTLAPEERQAALVVLQDVTDLRRADQARRTQLANISHDLRTPLTSLQAMIETLADGALDERPVALDFLRRMAEEVAGLGRLVAEFLELTRIEAGELMLDVQPTALAALLRGACARIQAQAAQRGVRLQVSPDDQLPPVRADRGRIEQVLLNLLQNALTHTPAGGTVTVSAWQSGDTVAIRVADTGAGIPPADLAHVFERFYKADRARSSSGSGLGLAIAKHLVARHSGTIWAESPEQHGTAVTFTLPVLATDPRTVNTAANC